MAKKTKRNVIIVTLLITAFLFAQTYYGFIPFLPSTLSAVPSDLSSYVGNCQGGFTTLSTSDVQIYPQGSRIRVTGVARGSECLVVNLKQNGLDSILNSQGYDATRDVVLNVKLLKYNKIFPIDQTGTYVGNFNNLVLSGTSLSGGAGISTDSNTLMGVCRSKGYSNAIYAYRNLPFQDIRCVIPGTNGISGGFVASRSYGDFDVLFDLNGQQVHVTRDQQSVQVGSNYIEWTGNLLNLDQIYPPQYDARLIGSKWELVQKGALQDINRLEDNFVSCLEGRNYAGMSDSSFDYCRSQFDSQSSSILQSKLSSYESQASNLIYDVSTDKNNLYVSLKSTPYPAFIMDLDAESVGIIALEGKPQITQCISGGDLSSGQNKVMGYFVKNNANVNNVQFTSSITCNQGVVPYSNNFNINSYETKSLTAELIPSNPNQNDLSYSCTLKVSDLKSGNSDDCSFSGSVKYVSGIVCQPFQISCSDDGKNVMKCTSDGKSKELVQECQYGCIYDNGYKCAESNKTITAECSNCDARVISTMVGWIWKSKQCKSTTLQNFTGCWTSWIKFILSFFALIFGTLFSRDLLNSFKALKKSKGGNAVAWVLAVAIGIGVAMLLFVLFWVGVFALGLFFVGKSLIKFTPFGK